VKLRTLVLCSPADAPVCRVFSVPSSASRERSLHIEMRALSISLAFTFTAAFVACSGKSDSSPPDAAPPDVNPPVDAAPQCGNHIVETGERCDDGNTDDGDGCTSDCRLSPFVYLKASNTGRRDSFGQAIALSADGATLAVAAPREASAATGVDGNQASDTAGEAGAVYLFVRSNATWKQQAYLKASNTDAGDEFGWSVSLSADGNTLAVGARAESSKATGIDGDQADNTAAASGAVYVFTRSSATWSQQAYVKASNTAEGARGANFGLAVALSGDGTTLAVGAEGEASAATGIDGDQTSTAATNSGAVYVFTRHGATWSQQAYVKASNTDHEDRFGHSVALSADGATLAVGASDEGSAATGVDGDQTNDTLAAAGAAYVFTRTGTTWSQQAYVKASNTDALDHFGMSVALSADGTRLAVGAPFEASTATGVDGDQTLNTASLSGALYLFGRSGATWTQQAYVKASNAGGGFGSSSAFSADAAMLVVSAPFEGSASTGIDGNETDPGAGNAGAAYVFTRTGATWSQHSYVKASNTGAGDNFGTGIALSGDGATLAAGAPAESSAATGVGGNQHDDSAQFAGAAYVATSAR
jgi:cysteine-rich repeat protein